MLSEELIRLHRQYDQCHHRDLHHTTYQVVFCCIHNGSLNGQQRLSRLRAVLPVKGIEEFIGRAKTPTLYHVEDTPPDRKAGPA